LVWRARIFFITAAALLIASVAIPAQRNPAASAVNQSDPLQVALNQAYNLDYDAERATLNSYLETHPDSLPARCLLVENILNRQMLKDGLFSGSAYLNANHKSLKKAPSPPPAFTREFTSAGNQAQQLIDARLKQNARDLEALYWEGVLYTARTEYDFALLHNSHVAMSDGLRALKLNDQIIKLSPDFSDAYFIVGVSKYVIANLPWYARAMASIAGYGGDKAEAIQDLQRVRQQGHWEKAAANIVLVVVYRREGMQQQALATLHDLRLAFPRNYLVPMEMAEVYGQLGDWNSAARVADDTVSEFRSDSRVSLASLLYRDGMAQEHLGNTDRALQLYLEAGRQTGKDMDVYRAELAAAQLYAKLNRRPEAEEAYQRVASAIPDTEEGKRARRALPTP
jgi:tetratricopeptide (TPR) repeat protein